MAHHECHEVECASHMKTEPFCNGERCFKADQTRVIMDFVGRSGEFRSPRGGIMWNEKVKKASFDNWNLMDDMPYHKNWEWLMTVVEEIMKVGEMDDMHGATVKITNGYTRIRYNGFNYTVGSHLSSPETYREDGRLAATYHAVLEFINWFNHRRKNG